MQCGSRCNIDQDATWIKIQRGSRFNMYQDATKINMHRGSRCNEDQDALRRRCYLHLRWYFFFKRINHLFSFFFSHLKWKLNTAGRIIRLRREKHREWIKTFQEIGFITSSMQSLDMNISKQHLNPKPTCRSDVINSTCLKSQYHHWSYWSTILSPILAGASKTNWIWADWRYIKFGVTSCLFLREEWDQEGMFRISCRQNWKYLFKIPTDLIRP